MKILFIYPAYESLAVEYLSALAKIHGHRTALAFDPMLFDDSFVYIKPLASLFSMRARMFDMLDDFQPDVIVFSVVTNTFPWFVKTGQALRKRTKAFIIAGGIHITSVPENVLKHEFVDAIIRGEGEEAFIKLLDSLQSGSLDHSLPNLGIREENGVRLNPLLPLIQDLDSLPFPDKDIYAGTSIDSTQVYTIMASRGCPYNCSFCNNNLLRRLYGAKGYVRMRSVENVIDELSCAKRHFRARRVNFFDEVHGIERKWFEDFAEQYRSRIALPYLACTNPNIVTDDYASLLADSGCVKVDLGVQTINEVKRREIYHRHESNDRIRAAIETLKKHGIVVAAENITNFPGETEEDMVEMARFYNTTRPDILKVFWLRYYPATEIIDIAMRHGVLGPGDVEMINDGLGPGSITVGGEASLLHRKFYALFPFIQLLPQRTVESILSRRLYRFIPVLLIPVAYTAIRLLLRGSYDSEIMMHQHAARYRHYSLRSLLGKLSKKTTTPAGQKT